MIQTFIGKKTILFVKEKTKDSVIASREEEEEEEEGEKE